ncbi:MAG: calcium-binding protein [Alcaligenaceae bacterium]|nr:calcium-binding protein [Alcaligenaceae bacterium]
MGTTLNAQDSLDGGEGRDTLQVAQAFGTVNLAAANFEVLRVESGNSVATTGAGAAANTISVVNTYDVERLTGSTIDTTVVKATTAAQTLTNVASGHTLVLNGQDGYTGTTVAAADVDAVTVNVKDATLAANTQDVLNVQVGRVVGAVATTDLGTGALGVGALVANGVESINITSSGANAANTIASVTSSTLTKLTISGDDALTITTALAGTTLNNIDASAATGAVTLSSSVTTAPVAGSSVGVTITGGSGADSLTQMGGTAARIDGGAGDDVIVGGNGADVIIGGAGNNTITAGNGIDSIDISGGAVDTVILRGITASANRDVVTGFTTGIATGSADVVSLANAQFTSTNATLQQVTAPGAIAFNTGANGFLEVAFDQTGGTALGLDGTGLIANTGAITVTNADDQGYIVAYQDGKAYLYHGNAGAVTSDTTMAAGEIVLVGVFNGVGVGAFVSENFLVAL